MSPASLTPSAAFGGVMPDWLHARARLAPDGLALVVGDARLTFASLDRRVEASARLLGESGAKPGDRVATLLDASPPYVSLVFAMARAGTVLVPLNTRLSPSELAWQIADCGATLLLVDAAHAHGAAAAVKDMQGAPRVVAVEDVEIGTAEDPSQDDDKSRRIDLAEVHTVVYTSGTTGKPKGAMLTYGAHWWSATSSALNLGLASSDVWLAPLPLFHVGGLSILMRGVIYGTPALVHERFEPLRVNAAIDDQGVAVVSVVAAMLRRMIDAREGKPYPATLRAVLVGGGPVPLPLLRECLALGIPAVQTYGLTETASQAVTLAPADALTHPGSAGKPLLPNEVRIERDGAFVGMDEEGEIVLRGPTVMQGYLNRPDATAEALRGGWLHTGDIGFLDGEGYLYVLDRRNDLIVSGGENVYPAEVEAALLAHPAVLEAGVVGENDERWGQVPVAYVVLRPDADPDSADSLIAFCRGRLARYKTPARMYVVESLPRNAAGKLLRRLLKDSLPNHPA